MPEETKTRRADVFAGKGSFAGMLKAQRERVESGAYADDLIDNSSGDQGAIKADEKETEYKRQVSMK